MNLIERLKAMNMAEARRQAQEVLQRQAEVLWEQVCSWEGKKTSDPFVIISPDNPHRRRFDDIIRKGVELGVKIRVRP